MAITSKGLAKILNISPSTVSMVFNNKPGVSEETRTKVFEAAKEYGYELIKKQGKINTKGAICLVIYKKHGAVVGDTPFFSQVTQGIESSCRLNGHTLQIRYIYENEGSKEEIKALNESGCIGILLLGTEMFEEDFELFSSLNAPIVVLDCYYDSIQYNTVLINNVQGAFLATNYLIRCGHKTIGYLHSSVKISNFSERADGYYKALRRHNMDVRHPYIFLVRPTTEGAYADMLAYLKENRRLPDCFFADNDLIAAACMRAMSEYGIKIPQDVSVIGFDNMPICEILTPTLSTMSVPKQTLGAAAVNKLLEIINQAETHFSKIELSTRLTERNSVSKTLK